MSTPYADHVYVDHDLPMLRVHRAWEQAVKVGRRLGVTPEDALRIAREVIAIIGQDTKRWGHLCPLCRGVIEWKAGYPTCLTHGNLGCHASLVLLIGFDPIVSPDA